MHSLIPGSLTIDTFIPAAQRDHGTATLVHKPLLIKAECAATGFDARRRIFCWNSYLSIKGKPGDDARNLDDCRYLTFRVTLKPFEFHREFRK